MTLERFLRLQTEVRGRRWCQSLHCKRKPTDMNRLAYSRFRSGHCLLSFATSAAILVSHFALSARAVAISESNAH